MEGAGVRKNMKNDPEALAGVDTAFLPDTYLRGARKLLRPPVTSPVNEPFLVE